MIDFHCHLDLYPDAIQLLPKVANRNRFTLVVTTSPRAWQATSRIFAGYDSIKVALGMHPEIVEKKACEHDLLLSFISQTKYVGEIGIDGSVQHRRTVFKQGGIFREILVECERVGGRILSIHSRNATSNVLDLIERHCETSVPILHWFAGNLQEAKRAVSLGCWFSVGPAMLGRAKGRRLLAELPITRILPETDGPFVMKGNRCLMPWEAIAIADEIAAIWQRPRADMVHQMNRNLSTILDVSGKYR